MFLIIFMVWIFWICGHGFHRALWEQRNPLHICFVFALVNNTNFYFIFLVLDSDRGGTAQPVELAYEWTSLKWKRRYIRNKVGLQQFRSYLSSVHCTFLGTYVSLVNFTRSDTALDAQDKSLGIVMYWQINWHVLTNQLPWMFLDLRSRAF